MNDDDEDFEHEDDEHEDDEELIYDVDDETRQLIELACNLISNLASLQLDPESRENLIIIADNLASRFALDSLEVEEQVHETEDGPEVIYKPKGGIFDEEDAEGS